MSIIQTLNVIVDMHRDGVISQYAIGGAVGATFYMQPAGTQDVDVFIVAEPAPGQTLVTLSHIYEYLQARGCNANGAYIVIADWPVQFLCVKGDLIAEALERACTHDVEGLPVRVFSAEHLAAIALQLGRPKDKTRLAQFVEADVLDKTCFYAILDRHGLLERWETFKRQFLD